jgi:hypothetical protein
MVLGLAPARASCPAFSDESAGPIDLRRLTIDGKIEGSIARKLSRNMAFASGRTR